MLSKVPQKATKSRKTQAFIIAMCEYDTLAEACAAVGISTETARRWLQQPEVDEALRTAQRQIFDQALSGLMLKVEKAIQTLDEVMGDQAAPPSARIRAADIILARAIDAFRASEIDAMYAEIQPLLRKKDEL